MGRVWLGVTHNNGEPAAGAERRTERDDPAEEAHIEATSTVTQLAHPICQPVQQCDGRREPVAPDRTRWLRRPVREQATTTGGTNTSVHAHDGTDPVGHAVRDRARLPRLPRLPRLR